MIKKQTFQEIAMSNIGVLGAGTGGMPAACELREKLGREHRITVVNSVD